MQGIRKEEHLDRKLDLLARRLTSKPPSLKQRPPSKFIGNQYPLTGEGDVSKARVEVLEEENDHKIVHLEHKLRSKTPSKPRVRKGVSSTATGFDQGAELGLEKSLSVVLRDGSGNGNPGTMASVGKGAGAEKTPRKGRRRGREDAEEGKTPRKVRRKLTGKKAVWGDEDENENENCLASL